MTETQKALWEKIKRFELDEPQADLPFSKRLAWENAWEIEYALRVILEYKKFMFMLCISPLPLTPSDAVDQVWHLHLIYTKSYWEHFCHNTLGKNIHHHPTKGGKKEGEKFVDWYDKTLQFYAQTFGVEAPTDIWLPKEERFKNISFQRINVRQNWILPKPSWIQLLWKFFKN
ncbi:MAG: hypothetical protein OHK0038_17110 [Flammeovirgaceae bacterium]